MTQILIARRPLDNVICQAVSVSVKSQLLDDGEIHGSIDPVHLKMVGSLSHSAVLTKNKDGTHDLVEVLSTGTRVIENVPFTVVENHDNYQIIEMVGLTWTVQKTGRYASHYTTQQMAQEMTQVITQKGGYHPMFANCHMAVQKVIESAETRVGGIYFTTSETLSRSGDKIFVPNDPAMIQDIITFLYILKKYPNCHPSFTLEPDVGHHRKIWMPDILGETVIGQVMFQVDYQMKLENLNKFKLYEGVNPEQITGGYSSTYIIPEAIDNLLGDSCTPDTEVRLKIVNWENYCLCMNPDTHIEYKTQWESIEQYPEYTKTINQLTKTDPIYQRFVTGYRAFVYAKFLMDKKIELFSDEEIDIRFKDGCVPRGDDTITELKHLIKQTDTMDYYIAGGATLVSRDREIIIDNPRLTTMHTIIVTIEHLTNKHINTCMEKYFLSKLPYRLIIRTPTLIIGQIDKLLSQGHSRGTPNAYFFDQLFYHSDTVWSRSESRIRMHPDVCLRDNDTVYVDIICQDDEERWSQFEENFIQYSIICGLTDKDDQLIDPEKVDWTGMIFGDMQKSLEDLGAISGDTHF